MKVWLDEILISVQWQRLRVLQLCKKKFIYLFIDIVLSRYSEK